MNIAQAKTFSLFGILEKIGLSPVKINGPDIWYHSPFRKEKTASFHINTERNVWYDFGEAKGGDVIDFVCAYLQSHNEDHTIIDALRWLHNMHPVITAYFAGAEPYAHAPPALTLQKVFSLRHGGLIKYLSARGISASLARKFLKEALVRNDNTGKTFHALCLRNENDGYELRSEFFKGCISPKNISFIRGKTPAQEIHVFEGMMDFLSALAFQNLHRFDGDTIILNSINTLQYAFPYIQDYGYRTLYSWLDNDKAGKKASDSLRLFAAKQPHLAFKPMNEIYKGHKDVNAWHKLKLGL